MTIGWKRSGKDAGTAGRLAARLLADLLIGCALCAAAAWCFYRSFAPMLVLPVFLFFFLRIRRADHERARQSRLRAQFRDFSSAFSNALRAGIPAAGALAAALAETSSLWGQTCDLSLAFADLSKAGLINRRPSEVFEKAAAAAGTEEILIFAEVLSDAERTGGDLIRVASDTAARLEARIEAEREIDAQISASRLQARVMCAAPLAVLLYLQTSMPDLTEGLYGTSGGALFMSAALGIYLAAVAWTHALLGRLS